MMSRQFHFPKQMQLPLTADDLIPISYIPWTRQKVWIKQSCAWFISSHNREHYRWQYSCSSFSAPVFDVAMCLLWFELGLSISSKSSTDTSFSPRDPCLNFPPATAGNLWGKTGVVCNLTSRLIYIFTLKQAVEPYFYFWKNINIIHCLIWSWFWGLDFLSYLFWVLELKWI